MTNKGLMGFPSTGDGSISAGKLAVPQGWGALYSGRYYYTAAASSITTSGSLGIGTLRVTPWFVPNSCTVSRLGAEVTTAGDVGSKVRLGIYADDGTGYPGALVIDAGTIAGDSNTVQEVSLSQALTAGLYWVAAAVQIVSVTQPTLRVTNSGGGAIGTFNVPIGTATPSAGGVVVGISTGSAATGAFPNVYPSFAAGALASAVLPRTFVKIA